MLRVTDEEREKRIREYLSKGALLLAFKESTFLKKISPELGSRFSILLAEADELWQAIEVAKKVKDKKVREKVKEEIEGIIKRRISNFKHKLLKNKFPEARKVFRSQIVYLEEKLEQIKKL